MKCPKCLIENDPKASFCINCGTQLLPLVDAAASRTKTSETPIEELSTGSSFAGRYQIIEELGKGGMGRVYKAYDKEISAKIAIKLIKPEVAGDQTSIARFRNELKLARDISHKNICRMYDLNKIGSTYYITMEYVHGEDLKKILRKMGILSPGQAISVAKQVCEGLLEAHKLGIIHRDLKPSNIMLDDSGTVRIMDFGIARALKTEGITDSGVIIGTPEYMSPEQVEAKDVDSRSDIYSLGIILYEMVTGKLPFRGDTPFSIGIKHKTEEPEEPRRLNAQIPEEFNQLILRCLKKQREERYQDAGELAAELSSLEIMIPTSRRILHIKKPTTSKHMGFALSPKKLIFITGICITSLVILYFAFVSQIRKHGPAQGSAYRQITSSGNAYQPSVSPDGRTLAFIKRRFNNEGGSFSDSLEAEDSVILIDLNTKQSRNLFSAPLITNMRWLPDSSEISLLAHPVNASMRSLYMIPRTGGPFRSLSTYLALRSEYCWSTNNSLAVGINNKVLFYSPALKPTDTMQISTIAPEDRISSIDWSLYNRYILVLVYSPSRALYQLFVLNPKLRKVESVYTDVTPIISPQWAHKSNIIYFLRPIGQTKQLYGLSLTLPPLDSKRAILANGPPKLMLDGLLAGMSFSVSCQTKQLFFTRELVYSNLWHLAESADGSNTITPKKISAETAFYEHPRASPDGKLVAYSKRTEDVSNIFVLPINGGKERQLTFFKSYCTAPVWSPDSKEIAFISNEGGSNQIWKLDIAGGELRKYQDTRINGLFHMNWAPGTKILYSERPEQTRNRNSRLMILDPISEKVTPLIREPEKYRINFYERAEYFPDGRSVAVFGYLQEKAEKRGLLVIDLDDLSIRFINNAPLTHGGSISIDGKWVIVNRPGTYKKIGIANSVIEEHRKVIIEIDGLKWPYIPESKISVLAIPKTISDVWVVDNFDQR